MKIVIEKNWSGSFDIYAFQDKNLHQFVKYDIQITATTMDKDKALKTEPSYKLSIHHGDIVLKALYEAIVAAGLAPVIQNATDAELKATKYHLEDMRMIAQKEVRHLSE